MTYKPLKLWFDKDMAHLLSEKIEEIEKNFDSGQFLGEVESKIEPLELKDRLKVFADALYAQFDENFIRAAEVLTQILGPENEEETGMFTNFYWIMPIATLVEFYGITHFEESMHLIKEITKRNTGEYCIRPFIREYPNKTLAEMYEWARNENYHIRRLASEGGRPRLPWASKLDQFIEDPSPLIPILEILKDDTSRFVQKSVANCINDILKDNPGIGQDLLLSWKKSASPQRRWIINHALRTYRKKNNRWLDASGIMT